jgi:hypothetical protein
MPSPALSTFILRQLPYLLWAPHPPLKFFEQLPSAPRGIDSISPEIFLVEWTRQGTADNSRKSALLAWYAAADRLRSEPLMRVLPSLVETNHLHARPRLRTVISKTRN